MTGAAWKRSERRHTERSPGVDSTSGGTPLMRHPLSRTAALALIVGAVLAAPSASGEKPAPAPAETIANVVMHPSSPPKTRLLT